VEQLISSFSFYFIILLSLVAVITDVLYGKIYNWLTFPSLLVGILFFSLFSGWYGFFQSILGIGFSLFAFGWMYALGWMGAGDVKFLMALGALGGWYFSFEVALLSVLYGGVMAMGILVWKGRLLKFINRIYLFFLSFWVKELEGIFPEVDRSLKMPFGVAMSAAAITALFVHPLGF